MEVKRPTVWTHEKQRGEESEKKVRREDLIRESQKKEDAGEPKGKKVAEHCAVPMICPSGSWKSRLAKAAGAEPAGQMTDEKSTTLRREAPLQTHQIVGPLGHSDIFLACRTDR